MRFTSLLVVACVVGFFSVAMAAQEIRGDYMETRSADVYTGQCFANGEVNLVGNEAILAWHVRNGSWDGVSLEGLTVAAAVKANGTLGDPYESPYPAKAVLLVDDQASAQQQAALVHFAQFSAAQSYHDWHQGQCDYPIILSHKTPLSYLFFMASSRLAPWIILIKI